MKNQTTTSISKRRIIFWIIGLLAIALIVLAALERMQITDLIKLPGRVNEETIHAEETKKANAESKQDFIESKDPTPAPAAQESSAITLSATQQGQSVTVLTKLENIADGVCKLAINSGDQAIERSANVIYQSEFSTCAGFSIPANTLPAGSWSITLSVTPNNGTVITKSITTEIR